MADSDVAFVNQGSFRGDLDAGPISYGELFEAQAYDHPVLRLTMSGAEVVALARHRAVYSAGVRGRPIDPPAGTRWPSTSSSPPGAACAHSTPPCPAAHPVGTEVEALSRYLERRAVAPGR